jgi:hypothetical protein
MVGLAMKSARTLAEVFDSSVADFNSVPFHVFHVFDFSTHLRGAVKIVEIGVLRSNNY